MGRGLSGLNDLIGEVLHMSPERRSSYDILNKLTTLRKHTWFNRSHKMYNIQLENKVHFHFMPTPTKLSHYLKYICFILVNGCTSHSTIDIKIDVAQLAEQLLSSSRGKRSVCVCVCGVL